MASQKLFELQLEISNIKSTEEHDWSELIGQVTIAELNTEIRYKEQLTFHLSEIQKDLPINLQLRLGEEEIGEITLAFGEIWLEGLLGPAQVGVRVNEDLEIELTGDITDLTEKEEKVPETESQCPYLQKLEQANQYEQEAQEVLSRLRAEIGDFLGAVEEEGLKSGNRSPVRSGSRSPTKSVRSARSSVSGGLSPYRRRTGKDSAVQRVDELPEIEIPCRFALEFRSLSADETSNLKTLIIALCEKLRYMKVQVDEVEQFKNEIEACNSAQNELNVSMKETRDQVHSAQANLERYISDLELQRSKAKEETKVNEEKIQMLESRLQDLTDELEEAQRENASLQEISEEDIDREIEILKKQYEESEKRRQSVQDTLTEKIKEFSTTQRKLSQQRQEAYNQKVNLEQQLEDISLQTDKLSLENTQLKTELTKIKAQEQLEEHIKQKLAITQAQGYDTEEQDGQRLAEVLIQLKLAHESYIKQANNLENSLSKDSKILQSTADSLESSIKEKDEELRELKDQAKGLKENLKNLQTLYNMKQDLDKTYHRLNRQNGNIREAKDQMVSELSWVSDYFLFQANSLLSSTRIHSRMKKIWDQKNFELEALKQSINQEKERNPVYTAIKGDRVDEALADFLNGRDDVVTVPFIREAPEVYLFGTKRVWLKFEMGKLSARVGGGFLPIEDFIEAYTDIEAEKFEQKHREASPEEKKFMAKYVSAIVGDSPKSPKKVREEIVRAVETREHGTAYGVKRQDSLSRSPSPTRTRSSPNKKRRPQGVSP